MQILSLFFKSFFTYTATEIDDFLIFVMLFASVKKNSGKISIFLGQLISLLLVTVLCGFVSALLQKIPSSYLKFLGILPLLIGIVSLFKAFRKKSSEIETVTSENNCLESDKNQTSSIQNEIETVTPKIFSLFVKAFVLTLAASADNAGVYIPFFTTLMLSEKIFILLTFAVFQILFSFIQIKAAEIPLVQKIVVKGGKILEPAVFILLGILILLGI